MREGVKAVVRGVDAGDGVDPASGQGFNDSVRAAAALDGVDVDGVLQGRRIQQLAPRVLDAQRDGVRALGDRGEGRIRTAAQNAFAQLNAVQLRKLRLDRLLGLVNDELGSAVRLVRRLLLHTVGGGGFDRLPGLLLPRQVKTDAAIGAVHCVALQEQKADRGQQDQAQQDDQNDLPRAGLAVIAVISLCRWHSSHLPFSCCTDILQAREKKINKNS